MMVPWCLTHHRQLALCREANYDIGNSCRDTEALVIAKVDGSWPDLALDALDQTISSPSFQSVLDLLDALQTVPTSEGVANGD